MSREEAIAAGPPSSQGVLSPAALEAENGVNRFPGMALGRSMTSDRSSRSIRARAVGPLGLGPGATGPLADRPWEMANGISSSFSIVGRRTQ